MNSEPDWKLTAATIPVQLDHDTHLADSSLARAGSPDATYACAECGRAKWMHGTRHDTCTQFCWGKEHAARPTSYRRRRNCLHLEVWRLHRDTLRTCSRAPATNHRGSGCQLGRPRARGTQGLRRSTLRASCGALRGRGIVLADLPDATPPGDPCRRTAPPWPSPPLGPSPSWCDLRTRGVTNKCAGPSKLHIYS